MAGSPATTSSEGPPTGAPLAGADVVDAVVIGAGPNGLTAANVLADHGWEVLVLEAQPRPGGAVQSAEVTAPGFVNDLYSSCHPMAVVSPVLRALDLERHGLHWVHAPKVLAQPSGTGAVAVWSDPERTAAELDRSTAGDGAAWLELVDRWSRIHDGLLEAMLTPFPPVRGGLRLLRDASIEDLRWLARLAVLPVRTLGDELFAGEAGSLLLAGNALHADFLPEAGGSGVFGVLMAMLAQQVGFPSPEGGSQRLTDALVQRLAQRGGRVVCDQCVRRVVVHGDRAVGVVTEDGTAVRVRRAVLADTIVTKLFGDLVPRDLLPARWRRGLERFDPGWGTVKVDWALREPIPWDDDAMHGAAVVHLGRSMDELSRYALQVQSGWVPDAPFLLVGQMSTVDPTRSPPGTEVAWAYTHVPQQISGDAGDDGISGRWDEREVSAMAARIEQRIEALAPGFCERIVARHVMAPPDLERRNPNLQGGAINGGTAQLHQELVFRPVTGLGRAETPIAGLYLASASAHPGGGVHGGPGGNAARAALAHDRLRRIVPWGGG